MEEKIPRTYEDMIEIAAGYFYDYYDKGDDDEFDIKWGWAESICEMFYQDDVEFVMNDINKKLYKMKEADRIVIHAEIPFGSCPCGHDTQLRVICTCKEGHGCCDKDCNDCAIELMNIAEFFQTVREQNKSEELEL